MEVTRLDGELWRWTTAHPEWRPGGGWEQDVPWDDLLGAEGGVRLCPSSWLGRGRVSDLAAELRPLLELPVERVLTSHGPPVTSGGAAALARALERYAPA